MIVVLVALVALLAVASFGVDIGLVWAARTQLQNATDSAALAAAAELIDADAELVTLSEAQANALDLGGQNSAVAAPSVNIDTADLAYGDWDFETSTLDTSVDLSDPDQVNAVQVTARLDGAANSPVPAFLSRILGRDQYSVSTTATGYIGYAGSLGPGVVDLPVAIDCCKLKGADCKESYCATVETNPPNPCPLDNPQDDGVTTVSCLEFHATPDQNACWTNYDGEDSSVNASDLRNIVEQGNEQEVTVSSPMYVDNGDKTPVIGEIEEKFLNQGIYDGQENGVDRYAPWDGPDSWVVALPVINCQSEDHCSGGTAARLVGVVCFEIREIEVTPDKIIRGRFLCKDDPLWDECEAGLTGSGGLDFGIRADFPVLVR